MTTDSFNVLDYSADPTGGNDSTNAIQNAINQAQLAGNGARVLLPYGRYKISATLRVSKGIYVDGWGYGDITDATSNIMSSSLSGVTVIWDSAVTGAEMFLFKSINADETLHGGGLRGILIDGNNKATLCVHAASCRETDFDVATYRPTVGGYLLDDTNGQLLDSVRLPKVVHRLGSSDLAAKAYGIYIKGNISGGGDGATNVMMGDIDIEYSNNDAIIFEECDTCLIDKFKDSRRANSTYDTSATATLGGYLSAQVMSIGSITNSGGSFACVPSVLITSGGGIGARAHAVMSGSLPNLAVASITPDSYGFNYGAAAVTITPAAIRFSRGGLQQAAYSSGTTYASGDYVLSAGIPYQSLQGSNTNHTPASSPTWWVVKSIFPAQKNVVLYAGRAGCVVAEDGTIANTIVAMNSEGGGIDNQGTSTLHYTVIDRLNGGMYQTSRYWMDDKLDVPLTGFMAVTGSPVVASMASAGGMAVPAIAFDSAATERVAWSLAPPDKWSHGLITGIEIISAPYVSSSPNVVKLQVDMVTRASSVIVGASEVTYTQLITTSSTKGTTTRDALVFVSPVAPIAYARDDFIGLAISRLGADGSDTYANDWGLLAVRIVFHGKGPNGDPGQWATAPYQII